MAAYPSTLPGPLNSGYQLNPVNQVIRTEMESGYTRARRRTTARVDRFPLAFIYTQSQMATFRDWFDDPTGADGGAAWFDIDLDTGDNGEITVEGRFAGIWQASRISTEFWKVTATIEVRYA